jgi:hypothetical protein
MRNAAPRAGLLVATAVVAAACSTASPRTADSVETCPGVTAQALVNGSTQESYLGIGPEQVRAIVQVVDTMESPDAGGPLCSGVFVTPDWVATASHCLQIQTASVLVVSAGGAQEVHPVIMSVRHPTLDVALLEVDGAALDGGVAPVPIPLADGGLGGLQDGDPVEIAGYGRTESGSVGRLSFLVEAVTALDDTSITVNGFGVSGACDGDSGGPMLVRGSDGSVQVAGILSKGSLTCTGDDRYVRLDSIGDWVRGVAGQNTSSDVECGSITSEGRCFHGNAVWCANGDIAGQACSGTMRCGWDANQVGYRCVPASTDPCRGVDAVGACGRNVALQCAGGVLETRECGCSPCRIDGTTGAPRCSGG